METNQTSTSFEQIPMPALLRHARNTYGAAMRAALIKAGYNDIPKNGLYVIGGLTLDEGRIPLVQLIRELRISNQAAEQLIDVLVAGGYLQRAKDPDDPSKLAVTVTRRGRAAAEVQRSAAQAIEAQLVAQVGAEDVLRTRRTLAALIDIGDIYS